jgi:hypothetical protein
MNMSKGRVIREPLPARVLIIPARMPAIDKRRISTIVIVRKIIRGSLRINNHLPDR